MQFTITKNSTQSYPLTLKENGQGWISSEGELEDLIETGPMNLLLSQIVHAINQATEMICLQSFLMDSNPIMEASKIAAETRGVRVYVLGSAEARLSEDNEEDEDWRKKDYIKLLEETFKHRFVFRQASYFHAKYILIDPHGTSPVGFLTTANFTGHAFSKNPEMGIKLSQFQIKDAFKIFIYHFWEHATDMQIEKKDFIQIKPAGIYSPPTTPNLWITSPNPSLSNLGKNLLEAVKGASQSIKIAAFDFESNHPICQAILTKAKAGLDIELFIPLRPKLIIDFGKKAASVGIKVFIEKRFHAKFLIIDDQEGSLFTANFATKGMNEGMEMGVVLNKHQSSQLLTVIDLWKSNFTYFLWPDLKIEEAPPKLTLISKDNKVETISIAQDSSITPNPQVKQLNALKKEIIQIGRNVAPNNTKKLTIQFSPQIPRVPSPFETLEAIAPGAVLISWMEGDPEDPNNKPKKAILLRKGIKLETIQEIPNKYDNYKIFVE